MDHSSGMISIRYFCDLIGNVNVNLTDMNGKTPLNQTFGTTKGKNLYNLNVYNFETKTIVVSLINEKGLNSHIITRY